MYDAITCLICIFWKLEYISLERKDIFEHSKQHFSSHAGYFFMFQNGLDRKDAIFLIVLLSKRCVTSASGSRVWMVARALASFRCGTGSASDRCQMWVEFVVDSRPAPSFFSGFTGSPPYTKPIDHKRSLTYKNCCLMYFALRLCIIKVTFLQCLKKRSLVRRRETTCRYYRCEERSTNPMGNTTL